MFPGLTSSYSDQTQDYKTEGNDLTNNRHSWRLSGDLPARLVPHRRRAIEVGKVGQMTTEGSIVAEFLVLDHFLARTNCIEEVALVVDEIAVVRWRRELLALQIRRS